MNLPSFFIDKFLCQETGRDPDYVALNKQFTVDIVKAGNLINTFPSFLKPCVSVSSPYDIVK